MKTLLIIAISLIVTIGIIILSLRKKTKSKNELSNRGGTYGNENPRHKHQ